jgi:hypothetical protein
VYTIPPRGPQKKKKMPLEGNEPTTFGLQNQSSTY